MNSSIPNPDTGAPLHDWDPYFFSRFEEHEKLKTKLIRGLAARICSSYPALKKNLKHVANDNAEVRGLIVAFGRNRGRFLGDERKENPAEEKEPVVEVDEDARVPMVLRARTFKQIVVEIGTARSRKVERAMQRAEERRHLASGSGDSDEKIGLGLEILTTENGKMVWVGDTRRPPQPIACRRETISTGEEGDQQRGLRGCSTERGVPCGSPSSLSGKQITRRRRSLSLPKGWINQETGPQGRAKSQDNTGEKLLENTSDAVESAVETDQSQFLEET